jgi:DNA repair exonuclease SbcCD ATPase subunit
MIISKKNINFIIHVSDVHIMKNRLDEFKAVFDELYKSVKKNNKKLDECLIVCTGDVFDSRPSPEEQILCKDFFRNLSELCDVVVIPGNHDMVSRSNQTMENHLSCALYGLKTENNVYMLGDRGEYVFGNIIFGYTEHQDESIYEIESKEKKKVKIALWHGTINGCTIDSSSRELTGQFNNDSFKSYDYVLLGDIHKFQYLNKKKTMWYPGSTLQLNHGESLNNHGYILLDLKSKESKLVELKNDYGFVTVHVKNNKKTKDIVKIPKNVYLRIIYENSDQETITSIYNKIKEKHNVISYVSMKKENQIEHFEDDKDDKESDETVSDRLIEYIKKNNIEKLSDDDIDKMEEIIKEKVKEIGYKYDNDVKNIKLKGMYFSNFTVYGEKNYVDFSDMKGKIINLTGRNGIGKSSIIQALIYGLYGVRESKQVSKEDYINMSKLKMEIIINLEVNGIDYKIHRSNFFRGKKRDRTNCVQNVTLYKNGKDISGKSLPDIGKQIENLIGSYDNFVNIAIMEQKYQKKFVDQDEGKRVENILKVLKFDVYDLIGNKVEEETKLLKARMKDDEDRLYTYDKTGKKKQIVGDMEKIKIEEKDELDQKLLDVIDKEENERDRLDEINRKKIEIELKTNGLKKLSDMRDYEKKNDEINKKNKKKIEEKIKKDMKLRELKKEMDEIKKIIENINDKKMKLKHNKFMKEKENKMKEINNEINKLLLEIVKVDIVSKTKDELLSERNNKLSEYDEMKNRVQKIKKEMIQLEKNTITSDDMKTKKNKYDEYNKKMIEIEKQISFLELNMNEKRKKIIRKKGEYDKYEDVYKKHNKKLEKEIKEDQILLNDKINKIKELKKGIINILEVYSENLDEKYDKYLDIENEEKEKSKEYEKSNKILDEYLNHMKVIKTHEYNEECEVCMKNKLTQDVISTKEKIKEYKKITETHKGGLDNINKRMVKMKKYQTEYDQRNKDKIQNDEIESEIKALESEIKVEKQKIENNKKTMENENSINNSRRNEYELIEKDMEKMKKELIKIENDKDKTNKLYKNYIDYEKIEENMRVHKLKLLENNNELELIGKTEEINKMQIKKIEDDIEKLNKISEIVKNNKTIEKKIQEKKNEYEKYSKSKDDEYDEYTKNKERGQNLEIEIMNMTVNIGEINNEIKELTVEIEKNKEIIRDWKKNQELLNMIDEIKTEYNEQNKIINKIIEEKGLIMRETGKVDSELKTIKVMKEKYKDKLEKFKLMDILRDVIRGGFIDKILSNTVIPKMCDNINAILTSFVNFKIEMEYDNKKIYIHKKDKNGVLSNAIQLSGYESLIFECAYRLFINKSNKIQRINCMCCDEIFSFMDETSISKIPNLFNFMRKLYDFVIIVSHDEKIQAYTDDNLKITNDGVCSKVCNNEDKLKLLLDKMKIGDSDDEPKKKTKNTKEYKKKNKEKVK